MMLFALLFCSVFCEPLLLTPLIDQGKFDEARKLSRIEIDGKFMGHSAFISVPSQSKKNTNNIFFWLQPCRKCEKNAPFL